MAFREVCMLLFLTAQIIAHPLTAYKNPRRGSSSPPVVCPNSVDRCSSGSTCCQLETGRFSCCPMENAVCCGQFGTCCAKGHACNEKDAYCKVLKDVDFLDMLAEHLEKPKVGKFVCPDRTSMCPDEDTCCPIGNGKDGCCPHEHAVCCPDQDHCCPEGYACSSDGKCVKDGSSHPMLKINSVDAISSENTPPAVVCPNSVDTCSQGSTCCGLDSGRYACCPMEDAVCCEQFGTCCAKGHACNEKDAYCRALEMRERIPFLELVVGQVHGVPDSTKLKPISSEDPPPVIVCPNLVDKCSVGSTCCMLDSGSYGCCPVKDAVCCSHSTNCCPKGYTCNAEDGLCDSKDSGVLGIPFL